MTRSRLHGPDPFLNFLSLWLASLFDTGNAVFLRIHRDGTGELLTAIRPAFSEEHVKRGQRSKLYVLELHELRLSQRQSFQKRVRLVYRRHIQQEDRTLLILACPPLLNSLLRDGGEELRELPLGRSS